MKTAPVLVALTLAAGVGCLPLVTTGARTYEDATSFEAGITLPIPVAWNAARLAPASGGPQRAAFVECAYEISSPDDVELLGQWCFGVGTFTNFGPLGRSPRVWEGVSCGMAGLSLGDASATGFYVAAGTFHPEWGGLFVRYTIAPDLTYASQTYAASGFTIAYWWGWIPSYFALEIAGGS